MYVNAFMRNRKLNNNRVLNKVIENSMAYTRILSNFQSNHSSHGGGWQLQ